MIGFAGQEPVKETPETPYDPGNPKPIMREVLNMKKVYETPKAVKYVFDYQDNVVASFGNGKKGKTGHASNSCYTHNGSDVYAHPCDDAVPKEE